jgi:hypothetical protein
MMNIIWLSASTVRLGVLIGVDMKPFGRALCRPELPTHKVGRC